ncbi:MAG TPA: helix-turn-helix transcriptional regulator [Polyangiaceae bacterium]|jgi:DNA-binding CsgD family transcriptional regulator|nr:helix-turn-helix transcriptional regulator [Polyangiaceae bacterium]
MDHVMNDRGAEPAVAVAAPGTVGRLVSRLPDEVANLAYLWAELIGGSCKVEEAQFSAQTCSLVLRRGHRISSPAAALSKRDTEILEQSLLDGVRKSVAADFDLCPSSIAEILRRSFAFMGLSCWPSRIPFIVVMAAHARHAQSSPAPDSRMVAKNQHNCRQSVSISRPDSELAGHLSRAEYAVTRLLIEGKSYAEMAAVRQTSKRTVANQLASVFHRLGVSGRAELLCLLAKRRVAHWQSRPVSSLVVQPPSFVEAEPAVSFARVSGQRR